MIPVLKKTRSALADLFPLTPRRPMTREQGERLARQWGRLNFHSVVRYAPKAPVFVHCHECRWPVSQGRTYMLLGNEQRAEATEEQMQQICEGVRRQLGVT